MTNAGSSATPCHGRGPRPAAPEVRSARGAILVQVAVMLVGLTALSAFVVDYGILWTARRQIQNTADAAALAAAISLAFDAPGDQARAIANAQTAAAQNPVWGGPATMDSGDITFAACPTGSVGSGTCVRVQAFREREAGSELPTVFASLVGIDHQGVRATATAQVLYGNSSDCVRPVAIPDRWQEMQSPPWDPLDTFVLGDIYTPPAGPGANGTGYSRTGVGGSLGDLGQQVRFEPQQDLSMPVGNERFMPVRVSLGASGPDDMLRDLTSCSPRVVQSGDRLDVETGETHMPSREGFTALIAQDPEASWDPTMNGGRGGVSGGCMSTAGCTVSPRIIPVVAFDPEHWTSRPGSGYIVVSRIVGLFVEGYVPRSFTARIVGYPAAPRSSMTSDPASAFVLSVALVR